MLFGRRVGNLQEMVLENLDINRTLFIVSFCGPINLSAGFDVAGYFKKKKSG